MRDAFILLSELGLLAIGYGFPFVVAFRGGTLKGLIGTIWGLSIIYSVLLGLGVPVIIGVFDPEFSREMRLSWLPEERIIVAIVSLGWTSPIVAGTIGRLTRRIALVVFPRGLAGSPFNHDEAHGRNVVRYLLLHSTQGQEPC